MSADSDARVLRVAVVGSGIAGMSTAYHIAKHAHGAVELHLIEQADTIGGHAHTHRQMGGEATPNVDVGFMVMNPLQLKDCLLGHNQIWVNYNLFRY